MSDESTQLIRIECTTDVRFYHRVKHVLDAAKHPAFLGPDQFKRNIDKGGHIWIYTRDGCDVATMWTEPSKTHKGEQEGYVISVVREWRKRGLAREILERDGPRYGRAIDTALAFFAECGYMICGAGDMKHNRHIVYPVSRNASDWIDPDTEEGKQATAALECAREMAASAKGQANGILAPTAAEPDPLTATKSFSTMVGASVRDQKLNQLAVLDAMLTAAMRDGKYSDAVKIQGEAALLLRGL